MVLRPPGPEDAEAVLAVVTARDVADIGRPDYTLEDVRADWRTPGIDPARDCFLVEEDGRVIGYALVDTRGPMVAVDPAFEGRGVGTRLRHAVEARCAERGQPCLQMLVAANRSGRRHLERAGYRSAHAYLRMRAQLADSPGAPAGPAVREFDLEREGPAVHSLVEAAFAEIEGNVPVPYATWKAEVAKAPPEFRLVLDDPEGIAGAAVLERWPDGVGYVSRIAVAGRARRRGHGRTLLLDALARFRVAGLTTAELTVHGGNPALGLYESVGFREDFRMERWASPAAVPGCGNA